MGIQAAQALGERSTQLTLKAFHSAGVRSAAPSVLNQFSRVQQLVTLPETLADSATLAKKTGVVESVKADKTGAKIVIGGVEHHVGKDAQGEPLHLPLLADRTWKAPKVGSKVEAGQPLSDPARTVINPRELYRATGNFEKVQNYLVNELNNVYKTEGVRRQHIETVVKAMSNLARVRNPEDVPNLLKGEYRPASELRALNAERIKEGKKPIEIEPVMKGILTMPLEVQEDWMAKLMHKQLRSSIMDAASVGATSNIHGLHPVPAAAYGAEFGLNKRHALQPKLEHLADVPEYVY